MWRRAGAGAAGHFYVAPRGAGVAGDFFARRQGDAGAARDGFVRHEGDAGAAGDCLVRPQGGRRRGRGSFSFGARGRQRDRELSRARRARVPGSPSCLVGGGPDGRMGRRLPFRFAARIAGREHPAWWTADPMGGRERRLPSDFAAGLTGGAIATCNLVAERPPRRPRRSWANDPGRCSSRVELGRPAANPKSGHAEESGHAGKPERGRHDRGRCGEVPVEVPKGRALWRSPEAEPLVFLGWCGVVTRGRRPSETSIPPHFDRHM